MAEQSLVERAPRGIVFAYSEWKGITRVVDAGVIQIPSGRLVIYDPSSLNSRYDHRIYPHAINDEIYFRILPGDYQVQVTLAEMDHVSGRKFIYNAYLSILLRGNLEIERKPLTFKNDDVPETSESNPYNISVDAGMVCIVDERNLLECMPLDTELWFEDVYLNVWLEKLDATRPETWVNTHLPLSRNNENIVICESGWGDGGYPVVGGFDAEGQLVRVHIDFGLIPRKDM